MASLWKFFRGILLRGETSDITDNVNGSLWYNSTTNRLKGYFESAVREVVTTNQTQTLTGKTVVVASNTITTAASGNLVATELNAALSELQTDVDGVRTDYVKRDGTLAMTGDLNLDGNNLNNVAEVNGEEGQPVKLYSGDDPGSYFDIWGTDASYISTGAALTLAATTDLNLAAEGTVHLNTAGTGTISADNKDISDAGTISAVGLTATGNIIAETTLGLVDNATQNYQMILDFDTGSNYSSVEVYEGNDLRLTTDSGNIDINPGGSGTVVIQSELSMSSNKITNVTNPSSAQDAATKDYVDDEITTHASDTSTHGVTTIAGLSETQTLSNKSFSDAITIAEIATPSTPASGFGKIYFKSDNNLYQLDDLGVETQVGSGSGGADTDLGNLTSPTAINEDLLPALDGGADVGSSSLRFATGWFDQVLGGSTQVSDDNNNNTVFGSRIRSAHATQSLTLETQLNSSADANATGTIYVQSGHKNAGTGNSGDIIIQTGNSTGGTRGKVEIDGNTILLDARLASNPGGSPTASEIYYNTTENKFKYYNGSGWKYFGEVVQMVSTQTGSMSTGSTAIPFDDTVPQNTEGTEFLAVAITPKDTNNILVIEADLSVTTTATTHICAALFQDSTASAIAATANATVSSGSMTKVLLNHKMPAGTTSSTVFSVRAGTPGGATVTFNGEAGVRRFGGVCASSIKVWEIKG